ncbi:MAG: glutamine--fructose-6-phosphate transaminase (isomerizing), partial [bacterium]
MCGIVGYIGKNNVLPVLIDGLKRLEYRGYDSSGIAICNNGDIFMLKAVGKIKELEEKIRELSGAGGAEMRHCPISAEAGGVGIAHTRWATHGAPTEENAHPHYDCEGKIYVVHNGIIENYKELKNFLVEKGHIFRSETDSEVIAHLIEDVYEGNIFKSVLEILKLVKGTYGLVVMHKDEPDKLIAARFGSPLLLGVGDGEIIVASDASAVLRHTKQVVYLDDGEVVEIKNENGCIKFEICDLESQKIDKEIEEIEWDIAQAEKQGHPHFMLKEIFEQPDAVRNSIRGRLLIEEGRAKLGGLDAASERIREIENIIIVGCGTAHYAGMIGEYMLEEYAGIPAETEIASEFRYRKSAFNPNTAIIAISQSGETADTFAAVREGKEKGMLTLGIVNAVGATIARATDAGIYNHIGPEIAVASTKAFVSQLTILALITLFIGRQRNMSLTMGERIAKEIKELPEKIKHILEMNGEIKNIAGKYYHFKNFAFLGRKYNYPVALEGALKLKEVSYIHATGISSGELKHGPIALIDENFPSFFIAPRDSVYEKNLSNMQEIKARGGRIIALTTEGNEDIKSIADDVLYIPKTLEMLTPIL